MFAYSSQAMTFRMPGEGRNSPVNESCQAEKNQINSTTAVWHFSLLPGSGMNNSFLG